MDVDKTLKELVVKNTKNGINEKEIEDHTNLIYDLGFDSVQVMSFIVEIEERFELEFDIEEINPESMTEYSSIKQVVSKKLEEMQK